MNKIALAGRSAWRLPWLAGPAGWLAGRRGRTSSIEIHYSSNQIALASSCSALAWPGLAGCLAGWLAGWLACRLAGWASGLAGPSQAKKFIRSLPKSPWRAARPHVTGLALAAGLGWLASWLAWEDLKHRNCDFSNKIALASPSGPGLALAGWLAGCLAGWLACWLAELSPGLAASLGRLGPLAALGCTLE